MKPLTLALCLLLASGIAQAQKVYKVIQPDGTVMFTDTPPADGSGEEVDVQPLNTTPPLASPTEAFDDTPAAELEQGYSEFRITSPGDDAAIRDNAGNVNVDLKINPSLRAGDTIELTLDGQSIGGGRKTAITLTNMDRGTHSLQALVKNASGKVVARSNSVTFTLQRRSKILQPSPPRAQPSGGGG
jgi:hypothetical protein